MNVYAVVILAAICVEFVASFAANVLNLRSLERDLPPEFRDVYDAEAYLEVGIHAGAQVGVFAGNAGGALPAHVGPPEPEAGVQPAGRGR